METPSRVSSCPVWVMSIVGGSRPTVPVEVPCPRPQPIWLAGPGSSSDPYMYRARRLMAGPA